MMPEPMEDSRQREEIEGVKTRLEEVEEKMDEKRTLTSMESVGLLPTTDMATI